MPPSRATLPSSPRFSVEHRRQLVLPSLSLSRERSVFIVLLLPLSHPTFRLGAILPLSLSPSKGFKREGERKRRGFNASMTFDHPVPPFSLLLGGFSRWPSRFRDIPPLLLREDCITPPENNLFDESFDGMIDPVGCKRRSCRETMERETIRSSVRVVTVEGKKIVLCTGASN